jgi:hypothetical protein
MHPLSIKKRYMKPELTSLGDVRSITLGSTPGLGESGDRGYKPGGAPFQTPNFPDYHFFQNNPYFPTDDDPTPGP